MKKSIIGHVECPVCGFGSAEVKEDKNNHAFIFCPDCAAQTFTRNEYRDRHLRKRMRPVTVTVTEPDTATAKPQGEPGTLGPVQDDPEPAVPKKEPAPVKPAKPAKKAGWFQPLMAGGGDE